MGVYIPGMELPDEKPGSFKVAVIYREKDGKVYATGSIETAALGVREGRREVIPVQGPHGDLIDRRELRWSVEVSRENHTHTDGAAIRQHISEHDHFLYLISCASAIIPEDTGGDS